MLGEQNLNHFLSPNGDAALVFLGHASIDGEGKFYAERFFNPEVGPSVSSMLFGL